MPERVVSNFRQIVIYFRIRHLRNRILSLCDAAREAAAPGDWMRVDSDARRIAAQRGDSYDTCVLDQVLAELTLLDEQAAQALTAAVAVDKPGAGQTDKGTKAVETGPLGPENRLPLTPTSTPHISKRNTTVIHARQPATPVEAGGRKERRESALRGFIVTPEFIVQIAPIFQAWVNTTDPTWHELLSASALIRSHLGISQHAWTQACAVLGPPKRSCCSRPSLHGTRRARCDHPGGCCEKWSSCTRGANCAWIEPCSAWPMGSGSEGIEEGS